MRQNIQNILFNLSKKERRETNALLLLESLTVNTNIPNLQASLTLAEKAKEADVKQMYQQAVDLYAEALERFRVAVAGF